MSLNGKEAKTVDEDKLANRTTQVTRSILERAINDPIFLLTMTAHGVTPKDIEIIVKDILEYLDKTKGIYPYLLEEEEDEA